MSAHLSGSQAKCGKIAAMAGKVREWNPILVRETRARFRHWGAFALLLGYAALLATTMGLNYADAASHALSLKNPLYRMPAVGHELFLTLTWMQALAWVLIAPAITASSIAREREDGLLESVLLSPLAPRQILMGKLLSALSFVALLILASLPVQAICFLMGGISPGDFLSALALHAVTAITGAAIGLACSAWSRRANIALRTAYILVVGWLVGSVICLGLSAGPLIAGSKASLIRIGLQHLALLFGWTNPIVAAASIVEPSARSIGALATGPLANAPWLISMLFQALLCALLLALSTAALRRPFEARDETKLSRLQKPLALSAAASTPESGHDAEWIEIPGASQLAFSNPVLQREARGKFRMKAPPLWALLAEGLLALAVAYLYLWTLKTALFDRAARETIWWVIAFVALFVIALAAAVMGASAFTREREGRTWDALRLSLLAPGEIIGAKLGAILLAFAVYSVPVWPLLLPCISPPFSSRSGAVNNHGVSLLQALASLGIVAATAFACALWGMWWSWRCKRTVTAVGWTLGSLFFLQVFFPVFLDAASWGFDSSAARDWQWSFNLFISLALTAANESHGQTTVCILCLAAGGALLWRNLRRRVMQGERRE
jgi:ABC-type transport system involved in multi-copper enzyme maturation permease subunit